MTRLKYIRTMLGLSISELADRCYLCASTLKKLDDGWIPERVGDYVARSLNAFFSVDLSSNQWAERLVFAKVIDCGRIKTECNYPTPLM